MAHFDEDSLQDELQLVATLSSGLIEASAEMLKCQDSLTQELRRLVQSGISVDAISEATGLPPNEVQRRAESRLVIASEADDLAFKT